MNLESNCLGFPLFYGGKVDAGKKSNLEPKDIDGRQAAVGLYSHFIPFQYREPHYSTKIWRSYFNYLDRYYNKSVFHEICDELKMPPEYVMRDDNWVSRDFAQDFVDLMIEKTGNPQANYEAGKDLLRPENLGFIDYELIRILGFPALFFWLLPKQIQWINRLMKVKQIKVGWGRAHFQLEPRGEIFPSPQTCENIRGGSESVATLYELDKIEVNHSQCIHRGDPTCAYDIKYSAKTLWQKRIRDLLIIVSLLVGGPFLIRFVASFFSLSNNLIANILAAVCSALILGTGILIHRYLRIRNRVQQYHDQSHTKSQTIYESYQKLDRRYRESKLLNELSNSLIRESDTQSVISRCLDSLVRSFNYSRSIVMLLNSDENSLETKAIRGFEDGPPQLHDLRVKYGKDVKPGLFAAILSIGKSQKIFDIETFRESLKPENRELLDQLKVNKLIACPLQDDDYKFGLLIVGSRAVDHSLREEDAFFLEHISKLLSLYLRSIRNLENERNLRNLFEQYVPPPVLQGIKNFNLEHAVSLAPRDVELTSFFLDIRGFTTISEHLSAERIVEFVNICLQFVSERINAEGGIIDKYVGDEVVAFFLPLAGNPNHSSRAAMQAAYRIRFEHHILDRQLEARGFPSVRMGIGLQSGPAVLGSMGGSFRLSYTAVGDTINVASRLQALTKEYFEQFPESRILICTSKNTFQRAGLDIVGLEVGSVSLRGRTGQLEVVLAGHIEGRIEQEERGSS